MTQVIYVDQRKHGATSKHKDETRRKMAYSLLLMTVIRVVHCISRVCGWCEKDKKKRNSSGGHSLGRREGDRRIVLVSIKTAVFWDMTPCTVAYTYCGEAPASNFREVITVFCIPWRQRQQALPKRLNLHANAQGVIHQKNGAFNQRCYKTSIREIKKSANQWLKVRPHRTRSAAADCGLCPLRNVTF